MGDDRKDATVRFHHIKSHFFRVIHADGAIGGLTPTGEIFFSLYSQRSPIPKITVQSIEDGHLSGEILQERRSRDGIVRELEVGVSLNVNTAKSLIQWLQQQVSVIETLQTGESQPSSTVNEIREK